MIIHQLPEATESVRKIGLEPTVIIIIVLSMMSAFALIVRWLMKRNDEKDKALIKALDDRRDDLITATKTMSSIANSSEVSLRTMADSVKDASTSTKAAMDELAREIRSRK